MFVGPGAPGARFCAINNLCSYTSRLVLMPRLLIGTFVRPCRCNTLVLLPGSGSEL